jgi:hypothetical protein
MLFVALFLFVHAADGRCGRSTTERRSYTNRRYHTPGSKSPHHSSRLSLAEDRHQYLKHKSLNLLTFWGGTDEICCPQCQAAAIGPGDSTLEKGPGLISQTTQPADAKQTGATAMLRTEYASSPLPECCAIEYPLPHLLGRPSRSSSFRSVGNFRLAGAYRWLIRGSGAVLARHFPLPNGGRSCLPC